MCEDKQNIADMDQNVLPQHLVCRNCGAIFRAEDATPRVVPKVKFNRLLQRILVRQMHNSHLNNLQEKLSNMCSSKKEILAEKEPLHCKRCKRRASTPLAPTKEKTEKILVQNIPPKVPKTAHPVGSKKTWRLQNPVPIHSPAFAKRSPTLRTTSEGTLGPRSSLSFSGSLTFSQNSLSHFNSTPLKKRLSFPLSAEDSPYKVTFNSQRKKSSSSPNRRRSTPARLEPSTMAKEQLSTSEEHVLQQIENLLLDEPKEPQPARGRKSLPDLSGKDPVGLWGRRQGSLPDLRPTVSDIWRRSSETSTDIWHRGDLKSGSENKW